MMIKKDTILMIAYTNYATDPRVIREAEAAVEGGFDVDFFTLIRPGEQHCENIRGVNVIRLNQFRYRGNSNLLYIFSYLIFFIRCFFKVSVFYFKKKYRVVHINNMPDFLVFVAIIPKLFGCKIILDIHDPMPTTYLTKFASSSKSLKYYLLLWQERFSAWFSDIVLTVHIPIKTDVLIHDGIPENKIFVISNFADDKLFKLKENYQLINKIKLIFHGTIAERFGLQHILKVFDELPCKNNYYFKIIGEGDYSSTLKNQIKKMKLEEIVVFENKFYPVQKLPDIIAQYDIGLICYDLTAATNYMLPLKMLECISIGLPVITIPNKAISYYFNKEDCFFYEPDNLSSLKKILIDINENKELIYEMRKRMVSLREKFIWHTEKQKYIELLRKFIV